MFPFDFKGFCRCAYMCCLTNTWNSSLNHMWFIPLGWFTKLTKHTDWDQATETRVVFHQPWKLSKQESNSMWLMKSISRLHTSNSPCLLARSCAPTQNWQRCATLAPTKGSSKFHTLDPRGGLHLLFIAEWNNVPGCKQRGSHWGGVWQHAANLTELPGAGNLSLPPILAGCSIAWHMVCVSLAKWGTILQTKRILHLYL